ncbi:putative enoyl-CoA hydratase 1 (plasmid) [Antarctobacter heliothermus]|uniref:Putative enoyl-CoA hydratase 1 n=1 Tax=Antarctobacter heliothermus TaxID=74033 RepID=A0A222EBB2_9RHOB|nr:MaoC family dehydratase [Antarctobacter heliothermus]ASP23484.1 putative enoyl-CoA hydratase 1 [Antarctobacter heliothermus]
MPRAKPWTIQSFEELSAIVGQDLGASDWLRIDQDQVNQFGESVDDTQWIHCDPERAAAQSPFGGTIVHGMLLLALLSKLRDRVQDVRIDIPRRMGVFYGLNRVRFIEPVKVGSRVRVQLSVAEATLIEPKVIHVVYDHILEAEVADRPAVFAQAINRIYLP